MALSSLGVLRFHQEKNPIKLWIPRNSDFIRDTNWLKSQFREGYRLQSILITAPNVLEPQVLQKVGETTAAIDCTPCCAGSAANLFLSLAKSRRGSAQYYCNYSRGNCEGTSGDPTTSIYRSAILEALLRVACH